MRGPLDGTSCAACGRGAPADPTAWRCACGGPWRLEPAGTLPPRSVLAGRPPGVWRYHESIPVPGRPLTLGEGATPLLPSRDGRLAFKVESANPTGSFKDRGAAVLLGHLVACGTREITEDSSGNAGAAVAAYAARAGVSATIFVPDAASPEKLAQIAAHGARVVRVGGSREDVARAAQAATGVYASHCWRPAFYHGTKTVAFELWEQLDGRAPGWIVTPVGHGTLLLGLALGFRELQAAGGVLRPPRLCAVQSAACAPLAAPPLGRGPGTGETVAEGIRIRSPVRAAEIVAAVEDSDGRWAVVDDAEILAARTRLGTEGLFVEPTAAVAAAAAWRLVETGELDPGDPIVVMLTGHGLKAPGGSTPGDGARA